MSRPTFSVFVHSNWFGASLEMKVSDKFIENVNYCLSITSIAFICGSSNILIRCFYPRLRNDNNCEKDAGCTNAGNSNEDCGEAKLRVEQQEQLGDGKAKKPKRAVVQTSYCLLEKGNRRRGEFVFLYVFVSVFQLPPAPLAQKVR